MPKKADDTLKTDSGIYKSQIEASIKYEKEKTDNIRVRVPKGWKEQIERYINKNNDKYSSINAMVCDLIQREVGIDD